VCACVCARRRRRLATGVYRNRRCQTEWNAANACVLPRRRATPLSVATPPRYTTPVRLYIAAVTFSRALHAAYARDSRRRRRRLCTFTRAHRSVSYGEPPPVALTLWSAAAAVPGLRVRGREGVESSEERTPLSDVLDPNLSVPSFVDIVAFLTKFN